ncbi:Uncharacterised protein [Mycobacteroides abscessus subsp. abscessus]|nr:Uncharacterised protein [Mycobacteroides abscessus subsp. abscessus]
MMAAVRPAPRREPSSMAPYPPMDQPRNATREVSRPCSANSGMNSLSTMAPESSPDARLCQ